MTVLISKSKKHLGLGRLVTKATSQLHYMSKVHTQLNIALSSLFEINEVYNAFMDDTKGISPKDLTESELEKAKIDQILESLLLVHQAVKSNIKEGRATLDGYHDELLNIEHSNTRAETKAAKAQTTQDLIKQVAADLGS